MRIGQSLNVILFLILAGNTLAQAQRIQRENGLTPPVSTQRVYESNESLNSQHSVLLAPTERSILQRTPTPITATVPTLARTTTKVLLPQQLKRSNNSLAEPKLGPLDRFAALPADNRVNQTQDNQGAFDELVPIKPERAPIIVEPTSNSMLTRIDLDAPRPALEPTLPEPYHQTPQGDLQSTAIEPISPAIADDEPCQAFIHHQHPTQTVPQAQHCRDEWANHCQPKRLGWDCQPKRLNWECQPKRLDWECHPKRLDWECDCDQFPRPEKTIHGNSCGCGCPTGALKERLRHRLHRLPCGCHDRCSGQCQQDQSPDCEPPALRPDSACDQSAQRRREPRHGPGHIGYGIFQSVSGTIAGS